MNEFTIITGYDGREYARFNTEDDCHEYCEKHGIEPEIHCVNGYMNGIFLDDVVTQ